MAEYLIQSETLDDIADAINAKTGGSSAMTPAQMVTAIGSISGGGSDISPFKFVKGTMTPSENTNGLSFPCGDITTVVFFEAKLVDYGTYISADNNGMGLGLAHYYFGPYFDGRTFTNSMGGMILAVYNGAFDRWGYNRRPTIDTTNQTAEFIGNTNVTFKAGLPIEYVMLGV